jgi:hypothetical protein
LYGVQPPAAFTTAENGVSTVPFGSLVVLIETDAKHAVEKNRTTEYATREGFIPASCGEGRTPERFGRFQVFSDVRGSKSSDL